MTIKFQSAKIIKKGGDMMIEISNKILNFRAMHNLSQLEMAKLCKVTVQTICNVENGVQNPSKLTTQKILNVVEKNYEE